ncbi:MAG: PCMD domain-containing protein [Bacteroidales bacterium]|nr:PCMD domain-containing protein [Bacteroidales bacterium]
MKKTLSIVLLASFCTILAAQTTGPQLYNSGFDTWSKKGGIWYMYSQDDPESKRIWDSPNPGTGKFGINICTPEYEHVAVAGKGKAACKVESRKVAWAFVPGNVYNGKYVGVVELKGVETHLGAPFSARPKTLSGYYHYLPKPINIVKEPYENMKGRPDEAIIEVILTDWDKPFVQQTHKGLIDSENDPHIIGRASLVIRKGTSGYVHFEAPFEYRNSKTPRYALFTIASSRFANSGTGASGTVLYVDEFRFGY